MDYKKAYNAIIEKYRKEKPIGYSEVHHITPRCIGGTEDKDNLISLPGRYHFVAHLCLAKIYGGKLIIAAHRMSERLRYNSRQYEWLKIKHAEYIKNLNSGKKQTLEAKRKQIEAQSGEKNPFYGKKHSIESKKKIKENHIGNRGKKHSQETKNRMSLKQKGKTLSEKTRLKLAEARKGKQSPMKGRKHSQESIDKMSKGHKGNIPWNKGLRKETRLCH